eukprot:CAMPEP_0194154646 /NCGR_PEP_ID=MMETSP0152-20130528/61461_1 /TAXON_ID=1049557 /ORGANISM="Thalassiothrix antarctica, Strain L6-D1" /LENGTH=348 /DNA_ID=CAMNT_0038860891 /DNA_START=101 /DNA_END=1144 /DNA_ORIENTATION=+
MTPAVAKATSTNIIIDDDEIETLYQQKKACDDTSQYNITEEKKDSEYVEQDYTKDAKIYEYGAAANPKMKPIPISVYPPELHNTIGSNTHVHSFDTSKLLDIGYPCTSPNLMASFIRINANDCIETNVTNATSQAFYVIRGKGYTVSNEHGRMDWNKGDLVVVPVTKKKMIHRNCNDTANENEDGSVALYWIHDEPLMKYLGVEASQRKFEPTIFRRESMLEHVQEIIHASAGKDGEEKNRLGVLLGNAKFDQTKTLTHVLWSLLNSIPGNTIQRPHRHNSVALDLCVYAPTTAEGKSPVYTLMGPDIDSSGNIIDPIRCDWVSGGVFITPPGWWHSHHNESENDVAW